MQEHAQAAPAATPEPTEGVKEKVKKVAEKVKEAVLDEEEPIHDELWLDKYIYSWEIVLVCNFMVFWAVLSLFKILWLWHLRSRPDKGEKVRLMEVSEV